MFGLRKGARRAFRQKLARRIPPSIRAKLTSEEWNHVSRICENVVDEMLSDFKSAGKRILDGEPNPREERALRKLARRGVNGLAARLTSGLTELFELGEDDGNEEDYEEGYEEDYEEDYEEGLIADYEEY